MHTELVIGVASGLLLILIASLHIICIVWCRKKNPQCCVTTSATAAVDTVVYDVPVFKNIPHAEEHVIQQNIAHEHVHMQNAAFDQVNVQQNIAYEQVNVQQNIAYEQVNVQQKCR